MKLLYTLLLAFFIVGCTSTRTATMKKPPISNTHIFKAIAYNKLYKSKHPNATILNNDLKSGFTIEHCRWIKNWCSDKGRYKFFKDDPYEECYCQCIY